MLFRKAILLIHGFAGGNWDYGSLGNELQLYIDFDGVILDTIDVSYKLIEESGIELIDKTRHCRSLGSPK